MGMTFDKAIENLNEIIEEGWLISDMEKCTAIDACELAIDTMRKYQKIQEIVRWNNAPSPYYKPDGQLFREICEVLEDGKID